MSTVVNLVSRTAAPVHEGSSGSAWRFYVTGGPPLDFDAPHDGKVSVHIDVLGRIPPDLSRVRITNTANHTVVWDVKALSNQSQCWKNCWNLNSRLGPGRFEGIRLKGDGSWNTEGNLLSNTAGTRHGQCEFHSKTMFSRCGTIQSLCRTGKRRSRRLIRLSL